jgi:hypothetical protein
VASWYRVRGVLLTLLFLFLFFPTLIVFLLLSLFFTFLGWGWNRITLHTRCCHDTAPVLHYNEKCTASRHIVFSQGGRLHVVYLLPQHWPWSHTLFSRPDCNPTLLRTALGFIDADANEMRSSPSCQFIVVPRRPRLFYFFSREKKEKKNGHKIDEAENFVYFYFPTRKWKMKSE